MPPHSHDSTTAKQSHDRLSRALSRSHSLGVIVDLSFSSSSSPCVQTEITMDGDFLNSARILSRFPSASAKIRHQRHPKFDTFWHRTL